MWDNVSQGSDRCNIGYWLTGTESAGCGNLQGGSSRATAGSPFYSAGNRVTTTPFQNLTGTSGDIEVPTEVATLRTLHKFEYYDSVVQFNPAEGMLFETSTTALRRAPEMRSAPVGNMGFWVATGDGMLYKTTPNSTFAVFTPASTTRSTTKIVDYWMAAEDMAVTGERDFSSLLNRVQALPEPQHFIILAIGLLGLAYVVRNRPRTVRQ